MKVSDLIKELKKYPQGGEVAWRDHDQQENEINDKVRSVERFDQSDSFDPEFTRGVVVVLSC